MNSKSKSETVVVLGASPNPERYSNMAVRSLTDYGHKVIPIHLTAETIEKIPVLENLSLVKESIDTLTIYLSPEHLDGYESQIEKLNPARIIFNPGTENQELMDYLRKKGFNVVQGCTLVMLKTGQF